VKQHIHWVQLHKLCSA